ncbi:Pycsar system effector family protein [Streptomyces sp. NPDC102437]|uniref:Pycsar system effector family protein n=1 Tax=Streptomyces sp. NPDC102437 TaxID=3366175 RepID=UPI0038255427
MTTTDPQPVRPAPQGAANAVAMLCAEMARADSKASLLLALNGAALAGVASAAPQLDLPAATVVTGVVGIAALVTSTVLLLLAVRPTLSGTGWPRWHELETEQLETRLNTGPRTDEVQLLQAAALRKYGRVQGAVDSDLVGIGFLVAAAVLTALL